MCVRLESYESKEHQDLVRSFLNGRFENTAFCILAPDGETRLSGSSRSPTMVLASPGGFRRGPPPPRSNESDPEQIKKVIAQMQAIAKKYPATEPDKGAPLVQDFHSFRQALNVASADQRLLLFVVPQKEATKLRETLRSVLHAPEMIGRFHTDFYSPESDAQWRESVRKVEEASGMFIIQPDEFGQEGEQRAHLPLTASPKDIIQALTETNAAFTQRETRKVYSDHVAKGRRKGIFFAGGMPYGEDRDGDGKIDHAPVGPPPKR